MAEKERSNLRESPSKNKWIGAGGAREYSYVIQSENHTYSNGWVEANHTYYEWEIVMVGGTEVVVFKNEDYKAMMQYLGDTSIKHIIDQIKIHRKEYINA